MANSFWSMFLEKHTIDKPEDMEGSAKTMETVRYIRID